VGSQYRTIRNRMNDITVRNLQDRALI